MSFSFAHDNQIGLDNYHICSIWKYWKYPITKDWKTVNDWEIFQLTRIILKIWLKTTEVEHVQCHTNCQPFMTHPSTFLPKYDYIIVTGLGDITVLCFNIPYILQHCIESYIVNQRKFILSFVPHQLLSKM